MAFKQKPEAVGIVLMEEDTQEYQFQNNYKILVRKEDEYGRMSGGRGC